MYIISVTKSKRIRIRNGPSLYSFHSLPLAQHMQRACMREHTHLTTHCFGLQSLGFPEDSAVVLWPYCSYITLPKKEEEAYPLKNLASCGRRALQLADVGVQYAVATCIYSGVERNGREASLVCDAGPGHHVQALGFLPSARQAWGVSSVGTYGKQRRSGCWGVALRVRAYPLGLLRLRITHSRADQNRE